MPYVQRFPDGTIQGVFNRPQPDLPKEFLADDAREVLAFNAGAVAERTISKVTILDRLNAAGLVQKAFAAMGGPGSYVYERWQAASDQIHVANPLVNQVLDAITDPATKATILAPELS